MAVLGEPWTALILRDLFIGVARFDALHAHLGVSRKVLAERLTRLVNEEIVVKRAYAQRPERFELRFTRKGMGTVRRPARRHLLGRPLDDNRSRPARPAPPPRV